jgi:predicted DNA-binding protein
MGRSKTGRLPVQISVQMPNELLERLRVLSAETGAPYSELVRRAIAAYLDQRS